MISSVPEPSERRRCCESQVIGNARYRFRYVVGLVQAPAAWAYQRGDEVDPNEGEPKHEINELQNRLHHTDDPSKENHIEGKIDALQEQRLESFGLTDLGCGFGFGGFAPPVW